MVRIVSLDHRDPAVAQQIHAVQQLAYTQEAQLLGVSFFPPLETTVEDVRLGQDSYLGAFQAETLVGLTCSEPDDEPGQMLITSLVVHPEHQRRGHARALLSALFNLDASIVFTVCTAVANAPALALYRRFGFSEYSFQTVGPEALSLVKLRREV